MLKNVFVKISMGIFLVVMNGTLTYGDEHKEKRRVDADGTVHVPAFDLPLSELLSEKTRKGLLDSLQTMADFKCPGGRYPGRNKHEILTMRKCADKYSSLQVDKLKKRYQVNIQPKTINGVYTEIFTPVEELPNHNKKRILINLHGGGNVFGARVGGQFESIPVSAMGKYRVISVDYFMFPEHVYPAASKDVVTVYRELLKSYQPENIGIYGCSAGAGLTARTLARLQSENLPTPGAAGLFCAGATGVGGDAYTVFGTVDGVDPKQLKRFGYMADTSKDDPRVAPGRHPQVLVNFPPTLLLSSVRDRALSTAAFTHSQLIKLGIEADLHVWEGLPHGGFLNPDIPEFIDAHNVIVKFFDEHLGTQ